MIDQQIIQTATLIKAANANDVNLENYWSRTREAHAKTDNCKLFDLARTKFGETRLWVHVKLSQCNRDGHQAFKLIWSNQLEVHVLDKRNPKNYKCICALAYHSEKKTHNWKAYVLCHKKCHDVQTDLVEQEFNYFTDRKKLTFLPDGIKCNMLDSVISVVPGGAARADF